MHVLWKSSKKKKAIFGRCPLAVMFAAFHKVTWTYKAQLEGFVLRHCLKKQFTLLFLIYHPHNKI